jgi:hypothetical protein
MALKAFLADRKDSGFDFFAELRLDGTQTSDVVPNDGVKPTPNIHPSNLAVICSSRVSDGWKFRPISPRRCWSCSHRQTT